MRATIYAATYRRVRTALLHERAPPGICTSGHRQAFWAAARRWTMRAIEAGLLSVDCLKAAQSSVHAGSEVLRAGTQGNDAAGAEAA